MTDIKPVTLEAEFDSDIATEEISNAVSGRRAIARKYVIRVRRRNPEATPAEIVSLLERHYAVSISTAGAIIAAGAIAADVGIALIPVAGAAAAGAKSASQQAAKKAGSEAAKAASKAAAKAATKAAVKGVALGAAKTGAQRVAGLLPAGDEQIQFEITAIFGLAIAEIHGMDLDHDQAHALVYGLSNGRVSQKQIATMAEDIATVSTDGVVGVGQSIAAGRQDWSHWANTLADTLPAGAAQSLVQTIQTGQLDTVRMGLTGKQQTAVEYGVGALAGGVTRFVFGRDVVSASRTAFADAPEVFPAHLEIPAKDAAGEAKDDTEPNRALAALEEAAKASGSWVVDTASTFGGGVAAGASAVGSGVANAASSVSKPFRGVDLDGDGIADEAQALTAVKNVGGAIAGVADVAGGRVAGFFKPKNRDKPTE